MKDIPMIDRLADRLAAGASISQAAACLGISGKQANALLQRMRKRLGAQAV